MAGSSRFYTLAEGQPRHRNDTSEQLRTGSGGGFLLMTSTQLIENLAHFSRERIPERSVHAKAAGARGYFEVTDDISDITDADFLTGIGKRTDVLVRIATTGPEKGSADTVRDFRGFAINSEIVAFGSLKSLQPVFFVRDPVKFPSLNRSHKRDPATNRPNSDMFWDFHINNQESIHALIGNTYKFSKEDGSYHYIRIHILTNQGTHYFTNPEGATLAGTNPDHHIQDLQEAIKSSNFPSWNVCVQTIRPDEIADAPIDIFDMTKIWPHKQYPLRKVGRMTLCKNPDNWFTEIEQAAFSPSNMVRGVEPSPDPMLQARMFAYPDAARYRLGINYQFLPTNATKSEVYCPIERDGFMNFTKNYGEDPNYVGSKIKPVEFLTAEQGGPNAGAGRATTKNVGTYDQTSAGDAPVSFASEVTEKDFTQATALWQLMGKQEGAQKRFVDNASAHISGCKRKWIRDEAYAMFTRVDESLGEMIKTTTEHKIENNHLHPHKTAWH
ncbi:MAG: hypothetical protein Q9167_000531 [Letrouitia subvulpina]